MTEEVAAACRAILSAGHEVVVKDGHEDAMNMDPKDEYAVFYDGRP